MEERRGDRNSRRMVIEMFVVGSIASVVGIAIGLAIDWFPVQASKQAGPIDHLWDILVIISVPIFVGVAIVVIYAARLFRQRPGEELLDGPPIHGNTKMEIVWTALPAILLVGLSTYAYTVLHKIEKAPASSAGREMHVDVYGQQFAWTYKYKGENGKSITTTRLYLPKDRSVKFDVHAVDVIHDFWVPAFRVKIDAVPGVTTGYRVTPTRLGTYPVVCAELCGLGHAFMRSSVTVMEQPAFDAWMAKASAGGTASAPAGGAAATGTSGASGADAGGAALTAADGKKIFVAGNDKGATACGSCHKLADAETQEGIGPILDDVLPGQTAAQIKDSILEPNKIISKGKPANVMPENYKDVLSPAEVDAVVAYLVQATKK